MKINRRNFIKMAGAGVASASLVSCVSTKPQAEDIEGIDSFDFYPEFLDAPVFAKFNENYMDEVCIPKETHHSVWGEFREEADVVYFNCPEAWYQTEMQKNNCYITKNILNNKSKLVNVNVTKQLKETQFGCDNWQTHEEFRKYMNEIIQQRYPNKDTFQINSGWKKVCVPFSHTNSRLATARFTGSLRRTYFETPKTV